MKKTYFDLRKKISNIHQDTVELKEKKIPINYNKNKTYYKIIKHGMINE